MMKHNGLNSSLDDLINISDNNKPLLPLLPIKTTISISIRTLTGDTTKYEMNADDTVKMIKDKIFLKYKIWPQHQKLIYGGHNLIDKHKLNMLNIKNNAILYLVFTTVCSNTQIPKKIAIQKLNGDIFYVSCTSDDTVQELKRTIYNQECYDIQSQILYFKYEKLENDKLLSDYNIQNNSMLKMIIIFKKIKDINDTEDYSNEYDCKAPESEEELHDLDDGTIQFNSDPEDEDKESHFHVGTVICIKYTTNEIKIKLKSDNQIHTYFIDEIRIYNQNVNTNMEIEYNSDPEDIEYMDMHIHFGTVIQCNNETISVKQNDNQIYTYFVDEIDIIQSIKKYESEPKSLNINTEIWNEMNQKSKLQQATIKTDQRNKRKKKKIFWEDLQTETKVYKTCEPQLFSVGNSKQVESVVGCCSIC